MSAAALSTVRARVDAAARAAGREPGAITLVGVSKTVPVERIVPVLDAGLRDLGENRAQELLAKAPMLADRAEPPVWHFVGQLQRNKVGALAPWVSLWHSVDREALGETIARRAPGARVLVEVNLGNELAKAGCAPADAGRLVDVLRDLDLTVEGLMTIAPQRDEPRRWFAQLRELAQSLGLAALSMGMSGDFEDAIVEGATIVRIGTALFGTR